MKKLLVVVVLVGFLCALLTLFLGGGIYLYAKNQESKLVLKPNLKELNTMEHTAKMEYESKVTATSATMTSVVFPEETDVPIDTTSQVVIDGVNKKVTITTDGQSAEQSFDEYMKSSPFKDIDAWYKVIDDGDYTVEDKDDTWVYTVKVQSLSDIYMQATEDQMKETMNQGSSSLASQGMTLEDVSVDFDGEITYVITISKETRLVEKAVISASSDLVMNMTFAIDPAYQSYYGIDSFDAEYNIKGLQSTMDVKKTEFKDNFTMPTNPLVYLLDDLTD